MSDWIERYHGSHPQKGWAIVGGGEEIVYLGELVSSEQVSKIVAAHNALVHDLSADNAVAPNAAPTQGADARPVAWIDKAKELHKRCAMWPETSGDGFMALLELRNHVETLIAASEPRKRT